MLQESKYAKIFSSNHLTRKKYGQLFELALKIRNHKNIVSEEVCNHIFQYLDISKFSFITKMKHKYPHVLPSPFSAQAYIHIFTCYQNKFNIIKKKIQFRQIDFKEFEFYQKATGKHKKGELKRILCESKSTPLTICLTYLARYGNPAIMEYIQEQMMQHNSDKKDLYLNIMNCVEKFGFERLYHLALSRRKRIIERYNRFPIEFKSLSFNGTTQKNQIIAYNKKFGSQINAFISYNLAHGNPKVFSFWEELSHDSIF